MSGNLSGDTAPTSAWSTRGTKQKSERHPHTCTLIQMLPLRSYTPGPSKTFSAKGQIVDIFHLWPIQCLLQLFTSLPLQHKSSHRHYVAIFLIKLCDFGCRQSRWAHLPTPVLDNMPRRETPGGRLYFSATLYMQPLHS